MTQDSRPIMDPTRRGALAGIGLAGLSVTLAACGASSSGGSGDSSSGDSSGDSGSSAAASSSASSSSSSGPCHGSLYSVQDGHGVHGPAPKPLPAKQINVSGGKISLA